MGTMRENMFRDVGLTDERYNQMMESFNGDEELIRDAIEDWGVENVNKGYSVFDYDGTGMLQVEAIGDTAAFNYDDAKAVEAAVRDGVQFIPVDELPENFDRRYLGWIDTPENRAAIDAYCAGLNS
jgi:hypothetical protein